MDRAIAAKRLKQFEGSASYMYRCTGGAVTVGCGHAIFESAHALELPWKGGPAAALIAADFARVAAAEKGRAALHYEPLTECRLTEESIGALLDRDIAAFEKNLASRLPAWTAYPEPAQQALFDMAYNLGVGGLLKFRRLLAACASGDWAAAATECRRNGIGAERNRETAALFEEAAAALIRPGGGPER